jgi:hypothetical protein
MISDLIAETLLMEFIGILGIALLVASLNWMTPDSASQVVSCLSGGFMVSASVAICFFKYQ